jgi:hypothetical protein
MEALNRCRLESMTGGMFGAEPIPSIAFPTTGGMPAREGVACMMSGVSGGVEWLGNGFDDGGTRKVDANHAQVAAKFRLFLGDASHRSQCLLRREVERECSLKFLARDSVENGLARHGRSESPFGVMDNPSAEGVSE